MNEFKGHHILALAVLFAFFMIFAAGCVSEAQQITPLPQKSRFEVGVPSTSKNNLANAIKELVCLDDADISVLLLGRNNENTTLREIVFLGVDDERETLRFGIPRFANSPSELSLTADHEAVFGIFTDNLRTITKNRLTYQTFLVEKARIKAILVPRWDVKDKQLINIGLSILFIEEPYLEQLIEQNPTFWFKWDDNSFCS